MRKWLPYADWRRPDVWSDIVNLVPTGKGTYKTPNMGVSNAVTGGGSSGTPKQAYAFQTADGTLIWYVGTSTKLLSSTGTTVSPLTDRTRAAGGDYSASQWSIVQYGNISIAADLTDATQFRDATSGTAFAALSGAPKAKVLVTQSNVVLAFNINDGASKPTSFATSDVGDYTNWSTGEALGATAINHRPGPITAAVAFKDVVIVFKDSSIYQLRYVGLPVVWRIDLIADGIGAAGFRDVAVCGDYLVFVGSTGAYKYDGATFTDIGTGVINGAGAGTLVVPAGGFIANIYWPSTKNVWFDSGGVISVYNIAQDAWGKFSLYKNDGTAVTDHVLFQGTPTALNSGNGNDFNGGTTFIHPANATFYTLTAKWNDPGFSAAVSASATTGYVGLGNKIDTEFNTVTPLMVDTFKDSGVGGASIIPAAAEMTLTMTKYDAPDGINPVAAIGSPFTSSTNERRFDLRVVGKWATFKVATTLAAFEIDDLHVPMKPAGRS